MTEKMYTMESVQRKVRSISKLTTLPQIATTVLELVENPKTSASKLGEVISSDQVLTARILKLANSAYYGFPRRISTLNLAIVVLGFNALRDLVMSISVIDRFSTQNIRQDWEIEQFWRHAFMVGMGARQIARQQRQALAGEAFVAGLLHDIGYLVMIQHFPKLFEKTFQFAKERQIPFLHAEYSLWGFSHAEIGAWLAEGWNLPEKIVRVIRYHHQPEKAGDSSNLTTIIHFADHLAATLGEGGEFMEVPETEPANLDELVKTFSSSPQAVHHFQELFRQEREKMSDFLLTLFNKKQEVPSESEIS